MNANVRNSVNRLSSRWRLRRSRRSLHSCGRTSAWIRRGIDWNMRKRWMLNRRYRNEGRRSDRRRQDHRASALHWAKIDSHGDIASVARHKAITARFLPAKSRHTDTWRSVRIITRTFIRVQNTSGTIFIEAIVAFIIINRARAIDIVCELVVANVLGNPTGRIDLPPNERRVATKPATSKSEAAACPILEVRPVLVRRLEADTGAQ